MSQVADLGCRDGIRRVHGADWGSPTGAASPRLNYSCPLRPPCLPQIDFNASSSGLGASIVSYSGEGEGRGRETSLLHECFAFGRTFRGRADDLDGVPIVGTPSEAPVPPRSSRSRMLREIIGRPKERMDSVSSPLPPRPHGDTGQRRLAATGGSPSVRGGGAAAAEWPRGASLRDERL